MKSTIIPNSGAHTLIDDEIIKSPFNKNDVATIKTNKILTRVVEFVYAVYTRAQRSPYVSQFEICCMSMYIKYFLRKYAGQELYKIFASHMLPLYIFYKHFGTTDCNISGNFEHFSFLDHFEIKRKVKDLLSLLLLLRSSP